MTTYFRDGTFAHQLEQLPAQVDFPLWQELLKGYAAEARWNQKDLSVVGLRLYGLHAVSATLGEDYAEQITNSVEDALLDLTAPKANPISPLLPVTLNKFAMRDLDSRGNPLQSRVNKQLVPVVEYWTMLSARRDIRREKEALLANAAQVAIDALQIKDLVAPVWQAVGGTTLQYSKLDYVEPFQAAYDALSAQASTKRATESV